MPAIAAGNLLSSDPVLGALVEGLPASVVDGLSTFGQQWGAAEIRDLGRVLEANPPVLRSHDAGGARLDAIETHPAWNALMRRSVGAGLHASIWDAGGEEARVRAVARAARLMMAAQVEPGHLLPIIANNAALAALAHAPKLSEAWLPLARSRRFDPRSLPLAEKTGAIVGFATTEKQGGSDLRAASTRAETAGDSLYRLVGHKWYVAAPTADGLLVTAQTLEGLTLFLVPRFTPDGRRNPFRIVRLKPALGFRALPAAEIEFTGTLGLPVGEVGRGLVTVQDTQAFARLDGALIAAGLLRQGLAEAAHFARHRRAFGAPLIDQTLMTRVLADMALDVVALAALAFRLAEAIDRAHDEPLEAAFARLMAPVVRYLTAKIGPALIAEAIEAMGAAGLDEAGPLARAYRAMPALAVLDGPGNILALDVVRVLRRSSDPLEAVLAVIEDGLGQAARSTLNVLRAAGAVALADEGSARILVEQLGLTVAAAALRRRFPTVVADAFLESRLGKPWRATYGMLDARFDARAFVDYVCPKL
ncbi:acyl-CoA dehydrogenase family protein [Prosthecomicrobium pneumaticum]|uniref:Putative acyl-CoA dehydrogenase n=1 Tax=Prosthecomicrobium pneumaticum TaxID=81895 RepID=A0A7W9FKH9_9HYPH|nr:putative acyl-CoA dehydrogenase [Prosthecomicrobium pneumaticum]